MPTYDHLIQNARIIDGTGNPWFKGDVALSGDRIAAVTPPGRIQTDQAANTVEGDGKVVCPGFIDIQSHSIVPLMADGRCLSKIVQGVTTEIMGEGSTPAPVGGRRQAPSWGNTYGGRLSEWNERAQSWSRFGHWLEAYEEAGVSPNVGSYLGGGTLRQYVKGMDLGQPTADELAQMQQVMSEAMEDGAFGVSYALIYAPDSFTETKELIEVCRTVSRYNGHYITHMRSEAGRIFEALEEACTIGRQADLPVEIYHLKASGRNNWDKMSGVIEQIDRARADGLDITADMYPYAASGTGLTSTLPPWASEGGDLFANLRDPEMRARIKKACLEPDDSWAAMVHEHGTDGVMPIGFHKPENKIYTGQRLTEIAQSRNQDWFDAVCDLVLSEGQRISTIYFSMDEANVRLQLPQPWIKISTDAGGYDPAWAQEFGPVHPRSYGTYPRVLGKYVREEGVLQLEDAVRKMSGAVADRLGLRQRGFLRQGFFADVVLFDPGTVGDRATFEDSHQLSTGVSHVWVNGQAVLEEGSHTGATPGRFVLNWG